MELGKLIQNARFTKVWVEDFIEYNFMNILVNKAKGDDLMHMYLSFWSFESQHMKNYVKCLYIMKEHFKQLRQLNETTFYMNLIELAMTRYIENCVKEKDKSMEYSHLQSDVIESHQIKKFQKLSLSQFILVDEKRDIAKLLQMKIDLLQNMIKGYQNIEELTNQIYQLVEVSNKTERNLFEYIQYDSQNINYLKLYSQLQQLIFNDPMQAVEFTKKFTDVLLRDSFEDKNLINSNTLLVGDVATIVIKYEGFQSTIVQYSKTTPKLFGIKEDEFAKITSLN